MSYHEPQQPEAWDEKVERKLMLPRNADEITLHSPGIELTEEQFKQLLAAAYSTLNVSVRR